jgi:thiol-disulfide isomerase/thioredoxin
VLIDVRRLAVALLVLAAAFVPLYLLLLRPEGEEAQGLANARLLETPGSSASKVGLKSGELAPDFEISTPEGGRLRLSKLRGRPVVVNFFALWCGSCLAEMPLVKAAQKERGLDAFTVLAVNTGESRERALEFIDFIDAPFAYGLDFDLTVSDAYGVRGLPHSVFIDANGVVRAVYTGGVTTNRLSDYLDAAIRAAEPGPQPFELRPISNIPRDHFLQVDVQGPDRLALTSRRLRCDSAYCADPVATALKAMVGVTDVTSPTSDEGGFVLEVRFEPSTLKQEEIVDAVAAMLNELADPLYDTPLEIRSR